MGLNLVYGLGTSAVLALAVYLFDRGLISSIYLVGILLFLFDMFVSVKAYYSQMARLTVTSACLDRIEEVYEAAKRARCYDFIMQLPEGFDTVIGEGGAAALVVSC